MKTDREATTSTRELRVLALQLAVVAGLGFQLGAEPLGAQEPELTKLEAWKATLQKWGGVWMTSNAAYLDEDKGIERFGMEVRVQPGSVAATACLWAERADGTSQVAWQFFQGWDPVRQAGLVYQSHWSGGVGLGYVEDRASDEPELVQDFWWPDGTTFRSGHDEHWEGPDARVSTSVNWVVDRWEPRRTYRWVRKLGYPSPC